MVLSQLMACMTIVPGHHMTQFATESSAEMPITEDNETILKRLNIQTITAQLIVNLEKDLSNFSSDPNNVANHYFTSGVEQLSLSHHRLHYFLRVICRCRV